MMHLFLNCAPEYIRREPYSPTFNTLPLIRANELGLNAHVEARVFCAPAVGSYVGGDITAGLLATPLNCSSDIVSIFIDVGTNGEIVIVKDEKVWAASTAAGPAFEGARISCGMRATHGAIEKVVFDDDVRCSTIGNATPVGLCGSGLIDLAAELLKNGLLSAHGQLLSGDEVPAQVPDAIKRRIRKKKRLSWIY